MDRRDLLLAAPAAGLALPLVTGAEAGAASRTVDTDSPRFAIAVLPDTQYLFDADSSDPAPLRETFRYLLQRRVDTDIVFMTHLGDTEHGTEQELTLASSCALGDDHQVAVFLDNASTDATVRLAAAGVPHQRLRRSATAPSGRWS